MKVRLTNSDLRKHLGLLVVPWRFAEDREADLYAAIDIVTKKIAQQIRKRHNKAKARHHNEASKTKQKLKERGL